MIACLRGVVAGRDEESIILDVQGVGYRLQASRRTLERLSVGQGPLTLWTELQVREEEIRLYGFLDREEQGCFRLLTGLNGIGPRLALAILSRLSPEELSRAVWQEDLRSLQAVPGVGRKTAQRLLFELRQRIGGDGAGPLAAASGEAGAASAPGSPREEAALALERLGYDAATAEGLLAAVAADIPAGAAAEEWLRRALRRAAAGRS